MEQLEFIYKLDLVSMLRFIACMYLVFIISDQDKYKGILRIDYKTLLNFTLAVGSVMLLRSSITNQSVASGMKNVNLFNILTVYWEDLIFVIPFATLFKNKKNKILNRTLFIALSLVFGYFHTYQGLFAGAVLSFAPAISLYYGRIYGYGTTMAMHVIYDLIIWIGVSYGGKL